MPTPSLTIAVSISDAPDRARLGFPAREVDRAFLTVCMALVRSGANVLYAGDLRAEGFTFKAFRHIAGAYASSGTVPFAHLIPEPVLRRSSYAALVAALSERRNMCTTMVCVGGSPLPIRAGAKSVRIGTGAGVTDLDEAAYAAWISNLPSINVGLGYSQARKASAAISSGRVLMGGKMGVLDNEADKYEGSMPGIVEEAIETLQAGGAVLPLGAFGGATRDIAISLGLLEPTVEVPRGAQAASYWPALEQLSTLRDRIPDELRPILQRLAQDDSPESIGEQIGQVLKSWPVSRPALP
jgi:hypothetical protein